jgi:hypothetical protein
MRRQPVSVQQPLVLSFVLLLAARAHAGNEDELFVSNDAAMMGGAVVAVVRDGGSLWHNPAGLGGADRDRVDVTANVYSLRLSHAPGFMRSVQGDACDADVREFVAVPSQISYLRVLSRRATLGLGYYAPRAANLIVREDMHTDAGDIVSDWSVDGVQAYKEYVFGATLGVEPSPGLRLGGGLLLRWESLTQSVAFFGQVASAGVTSRLLQVGSLYTHDQVGLEPTLGIQWEVSHALTLAASARGPRLGLYNAGETTDSESIVLSDSTPPLLLAVSSRQKLGGKAFAWMRLGRYFLGAAYRLGQTVLAIDGDLQPGLVDRGAGVERKLAWNVRFGASQRVSPRFTLGGGLFTDRGADQKSEEGLLGAGANFVGGSLGVRWDDQHRLAAGEPADSLRFTSLFAVRYAYARGRIENLTVDPTSSTTAELLRSGEIGVSVHELALYLGTGLYF